MTSTMQTDIATVPSTATADLPGASTAPASATPAPQAAAKAVAKRVARTPAKKVAAPIKPAAKAAITPVAKKAATKAAVNTPAKVAPKKVVVAQKQSEVKMLKAKKPKLVRDSFTIPKLEYLKLEELKHRSVKLGSSIRKSELIRAGIMALVGMSDADFLKAAKAVPAIKTGRPAKD